MDSRLEKNGPEKMAADFKPVFERLRGILEQYAATFSVGTDKPGHYSLEGPAGPATIRAWRGKKKSPVIRVARVETGKANVSYHLMGVYGNPKAGRKNNLYNF